jgi:hypothetical protein
MEARADRRNGMELNKLYNSRPHTLANPIRYKLMVLVITFISFGLARDSNMKT